MDWEQELLERSLSDRARRVGAAYAGPGAGNDIPAGERPPIGFTGGLPDPGFLPSGELSAAAAEVLAGDEMNSALQYGGSRGADGLRDWLAGHWSRIEGFELSRDNYTLTNGSAGALANVCETFLNPTDIALVESPSFPGSIRTIKALTPRVVCVPLDADGLDVDALDTIVGDLVSRGDRPRMLYTIPNFHNPTGATLTTPRRERLLQICESHQILVVEDDAYGELAFDGKPRPSLYSLAGGKGVLKLGSFSKIVAPGIRVGWTQAGPRIVEALVATRADMGTSPFVQRLLGRYAATGRLEPHIESLGGRYAAKCETMLRALDEHCSRVASWNRPDGGFFIWVTLADQVDPQLLADAARRHGVVFVSGGVFYAESMAEDGRRPGWGPGESPYIRLAFSYTAHDQIAEGIARFGAALSDAASAAGLADAADAAAAHA